MTQDFLISTNQKCSRHVVKHFVLKKPSHTYCTMAHVFSYGIPKLITFFFFCLFYYSFIIRLRLNYYIRTSRPERKKYWWDIVLFRNGASCTASPGERQQIQQHQHVGGGPPGRYSHLQPGIHRAVPGVLLFRQWRWRGHNRCTQRQERLHRCLHSPCRFLHCWWVAFVCFCVRGRWLVNVVYVCVLCKYLCLIFLFAGLMSESEDCWCLVVVAVQSCFGWCT